MKQIIIELNASELPVTVNIKRYGKTENYIITCNNDRTKFFMNKEKK